MLAYSSAFWVTDLSSLDSTKKSNNSTKVDTMIWTKYQMDESKYTLFIFTRFTCFEGTL